MSAFTIIDGDVSVRSLGIEMAAADATAYIPGTKGFISVVWDGATTHFLRSDTTGNLIVVGPNAVGSPATTNPLVFAGIDGAGNVRRIRTDGTGFQVAVGAADHLAPVVGAPVLIAGSDGTNALRILTDTAGRPRVVGGAAEGAPVVGDPVLMGGSDGTNARAFRVDTSARQLVVGATAHGGAVTGNPVLMAGSDGVSALRLLTDSAGRLQTGIATWFGSTAPTVGQKVSADSIPVVLASDQPAIQTTPTKAGTAVVTSVAGSTLDTLILAANSARLGATIYNNSNQKMYLKLGTGPSTTSFTVIIIKDAYYELPFNYTGVMRAVWATGVSGSALVTELTP